MNSKPAYTIVFLLITLSCLGQDHFVSKVVSAGFFGNETQISYYHNNRVIGSIAYTKLPLFPWYVAHSMYIDPHYRKQGYGNRLRLHLANVLKRRGVTRIYVQPGPFEFVGRNAKNITGTERKVKMKQLIKLYKSLGFKPVSRPISYVAHPLYKMLHIDEDPRYLMVKHILQ